MNFEEHLQTRVAEEKAREAQHGQARPAAPAAGQQVNDDFQDDVPSDDDAPTDWLAPKVYKGSSEV